MIVDTEEDTKHVAKHMTSIIIFTKYFIFSNDITVYVKVRIAFFVQ